MTYSSLSKKISMNGTDVYYESYPNDDSKETIILIHGFLSSSFSFRRLIPFLLKDYNIISLDLPPFGKSGKSRRFTYSYLNLATTVIQIAEQLQLNKITFMGHSMGGQIALHIAYLRPELVDRVILLCSSAYLKKSKPMLIFASYFPFFHLFVKRWLARSGVEKNLQLVVHDQSLIDKEMEEGYLAPFLEDAIFPALTKMIRDHEGDLSQESLLQIDVPCLLLWGEHDKVVPLSVGKQLNKDLKNSKLIILKETGHLVPEEKPEEVYRYIKQFANEAADN